MSNEEVYDAVLVGERLPQPKAMPSNVYQITFKCSATTPSERPNFSDILKELTVIQGDIPQLAQNCKIEKIDYKSN